MPQHKGTVDLHRMQVHRFFRVHSFLPFVDVAGFYTEYKDMVEFQFGLFNNSNYSMINSIGDAIRLRLSSFRARFHN